MIDGKIDSQGAMDTAKNVSIDTLGCGFLAMRYPDCTKHLGPIVPGTLVPNGSRVPGTQFELDPVQAAFNIGTVIRWNTSHSRLSKSQKHLRGERSLVNAGCLNSDDKGT